MVLYCSTIVETDQQLWSIATRLNWTVGALCMNPFRNIWEQTTVVNTVQDSKSTWHGNPCRCPHTLSCPTDLGINQIKIPRMGASKVNWSHRLLPADLVIEFYAIHNRSGYWASLQDFFWNSSSLHRGDCYPWSQISRTFGELWLLCKGIEEVR